MRFSSGLLLVVTESEKASISRVSMVRKSKLESADMTDIQDSSMFQAGRR